MSASPVTLADKLRPYVEEIKRSAMDGNDHAHAVIILYGMHVSCPSDPGAPALCEEVFRDWLRSVGKAEVAP